MRIRLCASLIRGASEFNAVASALTSIWVLRSVACGLVPTILTVSHRPPLRHADRAGVEVLSQADLGDRAKDQNDDPLLVRARPHAAHRAERSRPPQLHRCGAYAGRGR